MNTHKTQDRRCAELIAMTLLRASMADEAIQSLFQK